ncbi:MAG: DUF805 domain-containing protein [Pararhodobacter sp.]|nr:DUF805 domain-containing protein [Pararhodobacter sp.]
MAAGGWYYVDGAARVGPLEAGEVYRLITTGAIGPETRVWRQGMAAWQRAADHFDFSSARDASSPPPVPSAPPLPPGSAGYAGAGAMTGPDGLYIHSPARGFGEAVSVCFGKFITFSGRASRSEYWYFFLFVLLVGIVTGFMDSILFGVGFDNDDYGPLNGIASLVLLLPSLAVGWRRLHDIGRSGWWIGGFWLSIVASVFLVSFFLAAGGLERAIATLGFFLIGFLIYFIVMLVFLCTRGDPGPNRYG